MIVDLRISCVNLENEDGYSDSCLTSSIVMKVAAYSSRVNGGESLDKFKFC